MLAFILQSIPNLIKDIVSTFFLYIKSKWFCHIASLFTYYKEKRAFKHFLHKITTNIFSPVIGISLMLWKYFLFSPPRVWYSERVKHFLLPGLFITRVVIFNHYTRIEISLFFIFNCTEVVFFFLNWFFYGILVLELKKVV